MSSEIANFRKQFLEKFQISENQWNDTFKKINKDYDMMQNDFERILMLRNELQTLQDALYTAAEINEKYFEDVHRHYDACEIEIATLRNLIEFMQKRFELYATNSIK